uniref:MG2 domain-containing protein n=1 Tax=Candidatus Limisoma sp. TaxID=3076476 RepID=UPI0040266D10
MSKLLLAAGMALICGAAAWGKNNVPDFRYPETVINDATKQIEKADKKGNHKALVDGLVRLSIAKSQISADYMPELINHVDSFAARVSDVRAKSLLLGLESDIVVAAYQHESYKYDSRQKAGDMRPSDPREWCRENYEDRIIELTDSILCHRTELLATPVKDYESILEMPNVCPEFVPSLYDMLAHHCIAKINDLADSYPNGNENSAARQCVAGIYASLLASHEEGSAPFIYSELQRIKGSENNSKAAEAELKAHLLDLADKYKDSPYSVEILDYLVDLDSSPRTVALARKAVARHCNYPRINALRNFLKRIDQQTMGISYSEAAKPNEEILIDINKKNVDRITIRAYSVDGIFDIRMKNLKQMKPMMEWSANLNADDRQTVRFPGLPTGRYILVPEFIDRNSHNAVIPDQTPSVLTVSAIDIMMVNRINGDYFLMVVDTDSSKPIEGATVTVRKDEDGKIVKNLRTDANGYAMLNSLNDYGYYYFQAIVGNDHSRSLSTWLNYASTEGSRHLKATVFTDRGVYRPGETVNFAVAAYVSGMRFLETAKKKSLTVELQNTADETIASQTLQTDEFGRVSGSFTLPTDGLTGTFQLVVVSGDMPVVWRNIEVSEYKAPTFFIEIDREKSELSDLQHVTIKGKAMTFSQMPLAETDVKVALSESFSWWWDDMDFSDYETTVATDSNGEFSICVPAECFSAAKGEIFVNAKVSATDSRGETQTASAILKMGKMASLPMLDNITANADKPVALSQDLKNFDNLTYEITDSASNVVKKGSLSPDNITIDANNIASGEYTVTVSMPDGSGSTSFLLRLYRFSDAMPAFDTPMLIDNDTDIKCAADGSFALNWGNSRPHWFFYVIACDGNVTDYGWHHAEAGMHKFTGKAEFAPRGSSCLCLYWTDKHETKSAFITLTPATPQDSIEIVAETFRDNITPGGKETWKLRIKNNNGKTFRSAVIANMYDAALNSICINTYRFSPTYTTADEYWRDFRDPSNCHSIIYSPLQMLDVATFVAPWLNYYGRQLGYDYAVFECNSAPLRCYAAAAPMADAKLEESLVTKESKTDAEATEPDRQQSANLRDEGIKTAFFLPGLVTNEQGEVTFTFDVPNRNTQWQFSAVAYTDDLHAHYINRIVSAAKQLMVQPNLPRFVREGDCVTISAAAQNNTDTEQTVDVVIDTNGQRHAFKGIVLQAKSSKTVTASFNVPASTEVVVITSVCQNGRTADGQRDRIAVLPATTDVVEASPFYITADKSRADITMPHFNRNGRLTLEYADNPAWYAASALPSMQQTAETATAHIVNYYVATVASRIVADNQEIADAIAAWQKSPLKSRLEQNADLKTIALDNTPWSRRAETETDMMAHIADIADPATVQYRQQHALTALNDLQRPDGGFEWFRGCRSSIWTTEEVLNLFGYLNEMGYYPADDAIAQQIVKRAVEYCDNYYNKMSKREGATRKSVIASASDYIFIRSMLPVAAPADSIKWIADGVVEMAASGWGAYSILGVAKAANLLAHSGRHDV